MEFKNKKLTKRLSWVAVVLWMVIIFAFSAQPAEQSAGLSTRVTETIIAILGEFIPLDIDTIVVTEEIGKWHHIVRKMAHALVYLVLGVLMINAFRKSGVKGFRIFVFAFVLCVLYAASDEIHQLYVPGRGGQVRDVIIDSGGAFVGISGYNIMNWIFKR